MKRIAKLKRTNFLANAKEKLMFSKLKEWVRYAKLVGNDAQEIADMKTVVEFNMAYNNKRERQLLVEITKNIVKVPTNLSERKREEISKKNMEMMRKKSILEREMREKYNEKEIIYCLKNNPIEFFSRGWCYPDENYASFVYYESNDHAFRGKANDWQFLMPKDFWRKADNIKLFYEAGQKYWDKRVADQFSKKGQMYNFQLEPLRHECLGFQVLATVYRDEYYEKVQKSLRRLEDIEANRNRIEYLKNEKHKLDSIKYFTSKNIEALNKDYKRCK